MRFYAFCPLCLSIGQRKVPPFTQGSLFYVHLWRINFPDKHCICVYKRKIRHITFEIYRIFENCPLGEHPKECLCFFGAWLPQTVGFVAVGLPDRLQKQTTVRSTLLCFLLRGLICAGAQKPRKLGSKTKGHPQGVSFYFGADYGARTRHLHLGKVALYQMS